MSDVESLSVLIAEPDDLGAAAVERVAIHCGLRVVARAHNAIEALSLADQLHPGVVVLRHELEGVSGLEAARDLVDQADAPQVVLVSADEAMGAALDDGVGFVVVPWRDVEALEQALSGAQHRLASGDRRGGVDRRSGDERREHQDWGKVFSERRSGDDRRRGDRRDGSPT